MVKKEAFLRKNLKDKLFSELDIKDILLCKKDKAHYVRLRLLKENKIIRACKGLYRFINSDIKPNSQTEKIISICKKLNKKFCVTGLPIISESSVFLLYVPKTTSEQFMELLEKEGFITLIQPTEKEISILLNKVKLDKIVLIREYNSFYSVTDFIATPEKAIVDYYFELKHNKMPKIIDFNELFDKLFLTLNLSTLLKYAKIRNQEEDFKKMLSKYDIDKKVKKTLKI